MSPTRSRWPLLLAVLLVPSLPGGTIPAEAAPVGLPQTLTADTTSWIVDNIGGTSNGLPTGGTCDGSPGLMVLDASVGAKSNAFDNGLQVWVNDAIFVAPASVDLVDLPQNQTLTAGPVVMSGLNVTVQYRAYIGAGPHLRTLARFQNPGSTPVTATVKWVTNTGTASQEILGTGTANFTFSELDPWVLTGNDPASSTIAISGFALFGPRLGPTGPRARPTAVAETVFSCGGSSGILAAYPITVPPGATRALMFVNQLSQENYLAVLEASRFTDTHFAIQARVLDLSLAQRAEVLNWDLIPRAAPLDFNSDGRADIVTGTGQGGASHVRIWSGAGGTELTGFFAYDPGFTGGVRVATCDLTGDGVPDIVTAAGPGGAAHVRAFDGVTLAQIPGTIGSFLPYDPGYLGGAHVACADVDGDGTPDVITGTGVGGAPHVRVWSGATGGEIFGFFAYDPGFTGGVFVAP
jgi:hypothetical protein